MLVSFSQKAWAHYLYWQETDRDILHKINDLIKECTRTPHKGMGKPEALKNELRGFWSRRINHEHRLVYQVQGETLFIAACRFHYEK
ncbi:Txe/YoeB family addiction module toxin [Hymenobacter monticola]|uniref:Putative mRNA interferase YoeB n=1 Tax=Hymenobacter monticola TaxID=1705399 RepID=A0ABY4BB28_9BACT|nr:Txe/YoeB family addiction module toxin [Hymenobacter monticola]UOE35984.1 Txe/YoeB family addiction module toxin [Hymenobacter monticola]